jgi:hypothetical protein|nr:MAG TPA: hypothetical protein [Caudoviricetes sp.]
MKTIFKVGQEVYDQVNFPDSKGKIVEIERDVDGYWYIKVVFKGDDYFYHIDGSFGLCSIPTLSIKPYEVELKGFEQEKFTPTYDNVRMDSLINGGYISILHKIELPNERIAEAFRALAKLIWLRDFYNEGWQPNWKNNNEDKYIILTQNDDIECQRNYSYRRTLAFKTEEIRDRFFEEQKELLEIAKPLL